MECLAQRSSIALLSRDKERRLIDMRAVGRHTNSPLHSTSSIMTHCLSRNRLTKRVTGTSLVRMTYIGGL